MIDPFRFGPWVSHEATAQFVHDTDQPVAPSDTESARAYYDRYNRARLAEAQKAYPVRCEARCLQGLTVHDVAACGADSSRVLVCLHGGAFMWGRGAGALLEAVPVASVSGYRVLAVEYGLSPEERYPRAVDDVLGVYRELLEAYPATCIGMYGCSAGGILTAQVTARLIAEGLPVPGAIATICGTGLEFEGDAPSTSAAFSPRNDGVDSIRLAALPYFEHADHSDPLVFPGEHPEVLVAFPPTMLVTGSRDFAAGSVTTMHRRLVAAGVDARLFQFDGMWHAFHMATTLPESRELFGLLADFFDRRLGA